MSQCTFGHLCPLKFQISLRIREDITESSVGLLWIARETKSLYVDNEDSDQTAHMSDVTFSHVVSQM